MVILNNEGQAIRSTMDHDITKQYGQLISSLVQQTRTTVATLDDQVSILQRHTLITFINRIYKNELTFMRVRTKKHEIMIAPGKMLLDFLFYFTST